MKHASRRSPNSLASLAFLGSTRTHSPQLCATALIICLCAAGAAQATTLTFVLSEVDVIPFSDSAETQNNSEPSIGVNPLLPGQMISGAFTGQFNCVFNCGTMNPVSTITTPYYVTTDKGLTWSNFGNLQTDDKSIAWKQDGSAALTATLSPSSASTNQIKTYSGTAGGTDFGAPINTFNPSQNLDQPWVRTGPSDHVYVGYNNLSAAGGKTASVNVSTNGGVTYTPVTIETVNPGAGQDAPSIREAINSNTVYSVFTRWDSLATNASGGRRFNSTEVVVKSVNGGASFNAGTVVANLIAPFTDSTNTSLSLGANRVGSDNAIAVSRNDANRVVVAYVDSPAIGQMQVVVSESTNGGTSWTEKFRTPIATRSAQPAVTILDDDQVVLLYDNYDPATDHLSQHIVATSDDFATTDETILATETNVPNGDPTFQVNPYLGDFFDLTSVGSEFFGIFSALNADNGDLTKQYGAVYLFDNPFQRAFTGTPGMADFQLVDLNGNPLNPPGGPPGGFSIDPIFFRGFSIDPPGDVPEPGTLALLGTSLLALAALRRRLQKI